MGVMNPVVAELGGVEYEVTDMPGSVAMNVLDRVSLVRHETAREAALILLGGDMEIVDPETGHGYGVDQVADGLEQMPIWAFVDLNTVEVNYWVRGDASFDQILWVMAHELGHLIPDECFCDDEDRAESFAVVASQAHEFAQKIMKEQE